MATTLFFRNTAPSGHPSAGTKSAQLPFGGLLNNYATDLSLLTGKGSAQTSQIHTTQASTTRQWNYHVRFSSLPLAAQTFGSGGWTIGFCAKVSNTNSNPELNPSCYLWRPSNGSVVGYFFDGSFALSDSGSLGTSESAFLSSGVLSNFSGSNVTAAAGDLLVLEIWDQNTQLAATAYDTTLYFDGTTTVLASTTADAASFITCPTTVTFQSAGMLAMGYDGGAYAGFPPRMRLD